jgi:hypothetical protein
MAVIGRPSADRPSSTSVSATVGAVVDVGPSVVVDVGPSVVVVGATVVMVVVVSTLLVTVAAVVLGDGAVGVEMAGDMAGGSTVPIGSVAP